MVTRRKFLKSSALAAGAALLGPSVSAGLYTSPRIRISLAEWSLHNTIRAGKLDHLDFPAKARSFGIEAVEYVNGLFGTKTLSFKESATNRPYLSELLKRSKDAGVVNHLIMVDEEGPLALPDDKQRLAAVENHKKWIDAARFLGCSTVRLNLHGEGASDAKKAASIDSLSRLGQYAQPLGLNIVVENHGSDSSNGAWVAGVMRQVNMKNVGTLPDFGNFCLSHPWGTTDGGCDNAYDRYQGIRELLPFAKGVSAKTYDFDDKGEQPQMDYKRLMEIVKTSGFEGYIGIEFEGKTQPEDEGIRKTMALIKKYL
jgi:sugar phosphate isomerase/epimerase